jgi:hypothetical protein
METEDADRLLVPSEAAKFFRVSRATLASWRRARIGPAYVKLSEKGVRYRHSDLVAFTEKLRRGFEPLK